MPFAVFRLLAPALAQQYVERTAAAVAALGAVHGHHRRQPWQPGADMALEQGTRVLRPLAVQDQQAADIPHFAFGNELHQGDTGLVERLVVQVEGALQPYLPRRSL